MLIINFKIFEVKVKNLFFATLYINYIIDIYY